MSRRLSNLLVPALLVALGWNLALVLASEQAAPTFVPLVMKSGNLVRDELHLPVEYRLDSPFPDWDSTGVEYVAVQVVSNKDDHPKFALVYRVNPDGSVVEVMHEDSIYALPKLVNGVLVGAGLDGTLHQYAVPGWQP